MYFTHGDIGWSVIVAFPGHTHLKKKNKTNCVIMCDAKNKITNIHEYYFLFHEMK